MLSTTQHQPSEAWCLTHRTGHESNEKKLSEGCESQEEEILSVLRCQGRLSKEEGQGKQGDKAQLGDELEAPTGLSDRGGPGA